MTENLISKSLNMVEIDIPYQYRNVAKENKLFYDTFTKKWMINPEHNHFEKLNKDFMKVYLVDDYEFKNIYKEAGAKWDPSNKHWYTYRINKQLKEYFL